MIEKVSGIILSETPYNESSKIIQVLTKEHGLIGMIAKGAKSLKSKLRAGTAKYTFAYFYIYYKQDKLSNLIQVDIIDDFNNLKHDIILISYLTYLCDLTYQVAKQNYGKNIYNILIACLTKMNQSLDPLILTNIVELKYLKYLGIDLNLDCCIKCGNTDKIVTLNPDDGGFICQNCYQNEKIVDPKTIKLIRMYYYIDINTITTININNKIKAEINDFLTRYYDRYTGLFLKSKDFLNKMLNMN